MHNSATTMFVTCKKVSIKAIRSRSGSQFGPRGKFWRSNMLDSSEDCNTFWAQGTAYTVQHNLYTSYWRFQLHYALSGACSGLPQLLPPPPPHSASYNIAATTTSASRVSVLVGHRKRPAVQVTVAPGQHTHHLHHHMPQEVNALNG